MTVNRTTLLDLPLPVTGTEPSTWGDTTNNGLSQYMDIAIAGMNSLTSANFTAGALTLANTLGDSSATNIAAGSAQYATIRVSSLAVNSTITAPGSNRSYRIINADATYSLTIKASGQTGVTFLPGQTGVVAFNGTDYVIVGVVGAGTATDNAVARFDGTTGKLVQNSVVTIADSTGDISGVGQLNATTVDATNIEVTNIKAKDGTAAGSIADSTGVISVTANPILSGGTANGVAYLNGSKVLTTGSALTFDGTNFAVGGVDSYNNKIIAKGVASYRGLALYTTTASARPTISLVNENTATKASYIQDSSAGELIFGQMNYDFGGHVEGMRLTSTGLGVGTSSPSQKLTIFSNDVLGGLLITGANAPAIRLNDTTNGSTYSAVYAQNDGALYIGADESNSAANSYLAFNVDATERMRLDSSGNLGLGVTPSASTLRMLQGPNAEFVFAARYPYVASNTTYNGQWFRTNAEAASYYVQAAGQHQWFNAPSGTAGAAISFTQALTLDASGNLLLGGTSAGASSAASLAIFNGTAPTGSVTNGIILYAEDVSSSSELKVRDEAGNVTTLSPHNFSLIPDGPSEDMAWAYYSEKGGKRINVDMLKLARMVEKLTGEKLVYES